MTLGRLGLQDINKDGVPDRKLRLRFGVPTEQLTVRNDALALRADIDQDFVFVDPDDVAFNHVSVLEGLDLGVLLGQQLLHRLRLRPESSGRWRCCWPSRTPR